MRYYYQPHNDPEEPKRWITLKRGAPEWANLDCPWIRDEVGNFLISGLTYERPLETLDDEYAQELRLLMGFIRASDRAFDNKYPDHIKDPHSQPLLLNFVERNEEHWSGLPAWDAIVAEFQDKYQ